MRCAARTTALAAVWAIAGLREAAAGPSHFVELHGDVAALGYVYVKAVVDPIGGAPGLKAAKRSTVFRMAVDTGTMLSYLPCSGCSESLCGQKRMAKLLDRRHQSKVVRCTDETCPAVAAGQACEARLEQGLPDTCVLDAEFPGTGSLKGEFASVLLKADGFAAPVPLGCAKEMGQAFQDKFADGTLGLGRYSAVTNGTEASGWRLCLAPAGFWGGNLTIGAAVPFGKEGAWLELHSKHESDKASRIFWDSPFRVGLDETTPVAIGKHKVASTVHVHAQVNSGSAFSWAPTKLFKSMRAALFALCDEGSACAGNVRVTGDAQSLGCYNLRKTGEYESNAGVFESIAAQDVLRVQRLLDREFPEIKVMLPGKKASDGSATTHELALKPKEYMYRQSGPVYCVGVLKDAGADDLVLGANVLRGQEVSFDQAGQRLRLSVCGRKFDLALGRVDIDDLNDGLGGGSSRAHAGISGFFIGFLPILAVLCCGRFLCRRSGVNYAALNDGNGGTEVEISKFAIESVDGDSDDDDELLAEAYRREIGSDEDENVVFEANGNGAHAKARADDSDDEDIGDLVRSAKRLVGDSSSDEGESVSGVDGGGGGGDGGEDDDDDHLDFVSVEDEE